MDMSTQPPSHGNGFDPAKVAKHVAAIEAGQRDLDSERGTYMSRCRTIRDEIKDRYDEAKADGIPKKELKKVIKARDLTRKMDELREDLEPDEQDNYDNLRHALGDLADTPLGSAALKGNGKGDGNPFSSTVAEGESVMGIKQSRRSRKSDAVDSLTKQ